MISEPFFVRHASAVRLGADSIGVTGLRRPQAGAAWAVAAHATRTEQTVPAQIVLPTGSGKTAVLTLVPFLLKARRVLVVAPSRLIRQQLADAFTRFEDLRTAGVLSDKVGEPKVVVVRKRATSEDWQAWRDADVVVATVNSVSEGFPDVQRVPYDMFDLALFDEAHHVPADAWTALLTSAAARSVLATATPFRTDQRPLPGDEVYRYPLRRAIEERILAPVRFVPVESSAPGEKDRDLARAAVARLRDPAHVAARSRLLVRTNRVSTAEDLLGIYKDEGASLGLIIGKTSSTAASAIIQRAKNGDLDGLVCVGALIEGFDFPQLKIAAYHEPHRTLGPTLQFIGRLSRPSAGIEAELLAVRNDVDGETRELYESDPDWSVLLPDIVDAALAREQAIRRYADEAKQSGPLRVPVRAIAPPRQAYVYHCAERPADLARELSEINRAPVIYRFFHAESHLAAFVTHRRHRPRWLRSDALDSDDYQLHAITWVEDAHALFISSDSLSDARELVAALAATGARSIGSEELRRLLWAANPTGYHAVGLRTTRPSIASHTSYRSLHGPQANRSVSAADADTATVGHAFAYRKGAGGGTLGFSTNKGKFWEPASADTLFGYREWCTGRAKQLSTAGKTGAGLPGLPVGLGELYEEFPSDPLAAVLDHQLLEAGALLKVKANLVRLEDAELAILASTADALTLVLNHEGREIWRGGQAPGGVIDPIGNDIPVVDADTGELVTELGALLTDYPPTVFFADGSAIFGSVRTLAASDFELDASMLESTTWSGIDIEKEHLNDQPVPGTVQGGVLEWVKQRHEWVVFDHGSYETADFVGISRRGERVELELIHCKGSLKPTAGARVDDLYEVVGQTIRSTHWTRTPSALWQRLDHRVTQSPARVLKGGALVSAAIRDWAQTPPNTDVIVWAAQPGLDRTKALTAQRVKPLLAATSDQLQLHGLVFRVLCS